MTPLGRPSNGLIEAKGPKPAVFEELQARLTSRYPYICTFPDESSGRRGGPEPRAIVERFRAQSGCSRIVWSRVEEVLAFLIQTVNSLGLAIFDWGRQGSTVLQPMANLRDAGARRVEHLAVNCLLRQHSEEVDVHTRLAHLATYFGHVDFGCTHWHMSCLPQLLGTAANAFTAPVLQEVQS